MMWLALKQPRFWGQRSETQVSDLEAIRLVREASGMTLEEEIERPYWPLVFMAVWWKVDATPDEYLFRWDVCERVYQILLSARIWRHVLGELHPKRGWKLEDIAAGPKALLGKVGERRLRRILTLLRDESLADEEAYPWWVRCDIGVAYYRDWLHRQLWVAIRVLAKKREAKNSSGK